jgi:hypothetical protein
MGKPKYEENYEVFQVDDVMIYVNRSLLKAYVKDKVMLINLEGYGRFPFHLLDQELLV